MHTVLLCPAKLAGKRGIRAKNGVETKKTREQKFEPIYLPIEASISFPTALHTWLAVFSLLRRASFCLLHFFFFSIYLFPFPSFDFYPTFQGSQTTADSFLVYFGFFTLSSVAPSFYFIFSLFLSLSDFSARRPMNEFSARY